MRRWLPLLLMASACAQEQARPGILRGRLQEITATSLLVLTSAGEAVKCGLDAHTYMERDGQRIFSGALHPHDPLEVVADRKSDACYARTIRVIAPSTKLVATRPYRSALEYVYPRGNITFAGVVRRFNTQCLVLRTKDDQEKMILLRDDTRFLESGLPADVTKLSVNARVFIRGGRNIENALEAYQVIWGEISGPRNEH